MNARTISRTLVALALLTAAAPAAAATALATATYVKGEVTVTRAGTAQALNRGDPLYPGDVVATAKKSKATLVFTDGTIHVVRAKKSYEIGSRAVAEEGRSLTEVGEVAAKYFFSADQKRTNLKAIAGTRGGDAPAELAALAPIGELLDPPADLLWTPVPGARRYRVKLHEDTGENDPGAPGEELTTTAARAALTDFTKTRATADTIYIWRVTAELDGGKTVEGWSWFQYLSPAEAADLKTARERLMALAEEDPEDTTPHYLLANIYLARDLTFAAVQAYRELLARVPDDAEARQGLVDLYRLMRFSDTARAQFEQAFPVAAE